MTSVGLCVPQLGEYADRAVLRDFCQSAEELGFGSLWVQEHLFYPLAPRSGYSAIPGQPIPAAYRSTLAATETLMAAAAWTERVDVGTSVLIAGYHRPVELAQRLATLDVLSGGRLIAGFSVGWSDDEHEQMDVDPRTRGARTAELIDALIACWGPDPVTFNGRFFSIPESVIRPKPVQRPRPRLLSGMRSAPGRARTAALFDIWNPSRGDVGEIAEQTAHMQLLRAPGAAPLEVYYRVFLEPSVPDLNVAPPGIDGVVADIAAATQGGFAAVIVEPNFWRELDSAKAWAALPQRLYDACEERGLAPSG
jgi:probable F420-dependent oxidoreductase